MRRLKAALIIVLFDILIVFFSPAFWAPFATQTLVMPYYFAFAIVFIGLLDYLIFKGLTQSKTPADLSIVAAVPIGITTFIISYLYWLSAIYTPYTGYASRSKLPAWLFNTISYVILIGVPAFVTLLSSYLIFKRLSTKKQPNKP